MECQDSMMTETWEEDAVDLWEADHSSLGSSLSIYLVRQQNLGLDCSFPAQTRIDSKTSSPSAESLLTLRPSSKKDPSRDLR